MGELLSEGLERCRGEGKAFADSPLCYTPDGLGVHGDCQSAVFHVEHFAPHEAGTVAPTSLGMMFHVEHRLSGAEFLTELGCCDGRRRDAGASVVFHVEHICADPVNRSLKSFIRRRNF